MRQFEDAALAFDDSDSFCRIGHVLEDDDARLALHFVFERPIDAPTIVPAFCRAGVSKAAEVDRRPASRPNSSPSSSAAPARRALQRRGVTSRSISPYGQVRRCEVRFVKTPRSAGSIVRFPFAPAAAAPAASDSERVGRMTRAWTKAGPLRM